MNTAPSTPHRGWRGPAFLSMVKDACVYPMIGLEVSGGVRGLNAAFIEFLGYESRDQFLERRAAA